MPRRPALVLALLSLACAGLACTGFATAEPAIGMPDWMSVADVVADPSPPASPFSATASSSPPWLETASAPRPALTQAALPVGPSNGLPARSQQANLPEDGGADDDATASLRPFLPPSVPHPAPSARARVAPGLLQDASAVQLPEGGPGYSRAPSVYAPYQSVPPSGAGDMDAAAVTMSLKARGFSDVSRPVLRGRSYVCEATGPRRERVRLVVDAESGVISGLEVIGYDGRRE